MKRKGSSFQPKLPCAPLGSTKQTPRQEASGKNGERERKLDSVIESIVAQRQGKERSIWFYLCHLCTEEGYIVGELPCTVVIAKCQQFR